MKHYAVIQHSYSEFLGLIEAQLEKRAIGFSYFRPFVGQPLPGSVLQFDGLFVLAGAWPATDRAHCPWIDEELRLIGLFRNAERPVVGIGLGGLLVAQTAGAAPSETPFHCAYWTTARATPAGRDDALARAVDGRRVLVMANGSASLPEGLEAIVTDEEGRWIAVRPDRFTYGLLFRPELKPGMIEDIIMEAKREVPEDIDALLATARMEWHGTQETTERVIVALVQELDLMQERRKPPVFRLKIE
jgi:GMP synthase (glutamine-hydrolysing)